MNNKHGKSTGFTLVELLMVILIIGVIAAVLLPAFNNQQEQSRISKTKAHLASLRMAVDLYYQNEGVWPGTNLVNLYNGTSPSNKIYISEIPEDAIMNNSTVTQTPDYASGGWYWDTINHEVYLNLSGTDANGDQYSEY